MLDLEDSVPQDAKATARRTLRAAWGELRAAGVPLVLRINAGEQGGDDLVALAPLLAGAAVMVSKAESAAALSHIGARLPGSAILPLIESAAGLAALSEIASAPLVLRLAVGHLDFMADTGLQCGDDESELAPLRFALAMATRVQRLAPAVDGVTVAIDDDERLRRDTQRALRFGFGAKLCIHPRQVPVVHEALAPSAEQLAWAKRVLAADASAGGAAVQLDGRMVDAPVVAQARLLLARAH